MTEKKSYKFSNGIEATQEELTIEQDYKLMDLLSELGIGEGQELMNTPIKDIIGKLVKNDMLSKLLNIILTEKDKIVDEGGNTLAGLVDWKTLKNSELQEVMTDFFSLNPLVLQLFRGLGSGLGMMNTNTTLSGSEPNAESTTQDS